MGAENYRDLNLDVVSLTKHIDAVNVPVLLIHGRDDTVVPFDQSDVMLAAMKKAGRKVELVTLKKEEKPWSPSSKPTARPTEKDCSSIEPTAQ
jgi:pimeloyl-ACP methyl ester carboxylesterase